MVPEGWNTAPISGLLESCTYGINAKLDGNTDGIPVLRMSNIHDHRLDLRELKYAPETELSGTQHLLQRGDVLFNRTNSADKVGKVALVDVDQRLSYASYLLRLRALDSVASAWLYYQLASDAVQVQLKALATVGVSQVNINPTQMRALILSVPPLAEQRKIAAILSSVDDCIAKTEAVIAQLGVVKRAMMQELLTRGLPGRHTRFKKTEIGEIPEEWEVVRVGDAGSVDAGKARDPGASGTLRPYLRVANVFDGEIRVTDVLEMPFTDAEFARSQLRAGDVLLNEGQSLELVGRCSLYRNELGRPCGIQNALLRFRSTGLVAAEFAEQYFRWCQYSGRFAEVATQTTSIAHLGLKRFASMWMPVPSANEQHNIVSILAALDHRLRRENVMAQQIKATKSSLMSVLLTGEVRVKPVDES